MGTVFSTEPKEEKGEIVHHDNFESENVPLSTIADSIRFIIRRDSERSLANLANYNEPKSPWLLDSGTRSPMLSHMVKLPDFDERRQKQLQKHKADKRGRLRQLEQGKDQDGGSGEGRNRIGSFDAQGEAHNIKLMPLEDEEEQWERKRVQKLRKVVERSTSTTSLASTTSFSPTADILNDLKAEFAKESNPTSVCIMYGLINAIIVLPVIMSFGSIIFHDEFFKPYLPVLVELTIISGVVHQIMFSSFSMLPFSVGSVQDAGLIFLSTMASSIVHYCKERNHDDETILATTLIGLSLSTAILGLGLMIIGRLKLAGYVRYLPTPVVGGYLAFIGFYCGQGGLSLMSGVTVSNILQWPVLFEGRSALLVAPGLIGGFGIFFLVNKLKHMAVLPLSVVFILSSFYVSLIVTGTSLDSAKEMGWVSSADDPPVWYETWDWFQFDKVVWDAFPGQILTLCSMIFVVALSSSLDIAAIDLEIPKPLEYNHELRMIGLSNLISGLTGGYTGSYIFSQSIFSLRAGIRSRLSGFVIAIVGAATVVMPFSIVSFVPNFIFGSLLVMICADLMVEWLWDVRKKLTRAEYFVALSTFVLIQILSVEHGIIAGCFLYVFLLKLGFDVSDIKGSKTEPVEPTVKTNVKSYGGIDKCCSADDFEASTSTLSSGSPIML